MDNGGPDRVHGNRLELSPNPLTPALKRGSLALRRLA